MLDFQWIEQPTIDYQQILVAQALVWEICRIKFYSTDLCAGPEIHGIWRWWRLDADIRGLSGPWAKIERIKFYSTVLWHQLICSRVLL